MQRNEYAKSFSSSRKVSKEVCVDCRMELGVNYKCKTCCVARNPLLKLKSRQASKNNAGSEAHGKDTSDSQTPSKGKVKDGFYSLSLDKVDNIPIKSKVFIRELACTASVIRQLKNGQGVVDKYRVAYDESDDVDFEEDKEGDHRREGVYRYFGYGNCNVWPASALNHNEEVNVFWGFNERCHEQRANMYACIRGHGRVVGVATKMNLDPVFYHIKLDDNQDGHLHCFCHVFDVTSAPTTPAQQPAQPPSHQVPSAPTTPAQQPAPPPSHQVPSAPTTPAQQPAAPPSHQARQRKCKECGIMFPFVLRKTLCSQCDVQTFREVPPSAAADIGSSASSSNDSDDSDNDAFGRKRQRARKFTPLKEEVSTIMYAIAADCPYTHHRDSQKKCFAKALKCLHRNGKAKSCTKPRQLLAWCNKVCETHYKDTMLKEMKSGNADVRTPTILDTVAGDWAEYQLRSGRTSKVNKKHAEVIRDACISTSRTLPEFAAAIANARTKHNAILRTMTSGASDESRTSATPTTPSTSKTLSGRQAGQALQAAIFAAVTPPLSNVAPSTLSTFSTRLVALEEQLYSSQTSTFVSKLEPHVCNIMTALGVETMEDLNEIEEEQDDAAIAACKLNFIAGNRLRGVLRAQREAQRILL
jgi:hypothetical protein